MLGRDARSVRSFGKTDGHAIEALNRGRMRTERADMAKRKRTRRWIERAVLPVKTR